MSEEYKPFNVENDPNYNREPGIVIVPGSNYANEMQKFEQWPSKYGANPGNPYRYRPFPKMLYRAQLWSGIAKCMAPPPDPAEYADPREYERTIDMARKFTEQCQLIVKDEIEYQRARENGWCEDPVEAVEYLKRRERDRSNATAERNYDDRNMSEPAKREAAAAVAEAGGEHLPEIPEKPKKRRGRPPKNAAA